MHVHVHVANMLVWHVFQCIPTTMEIGRYRKQKSRTVQVLKLTINTRAKKMIVNQHRNKNSPSHTPLTPSHPHTLTPSHPHSTTRQCKKLWTAHPKRVRGLSFILVSTTRALHSTNQFHLSEQVHPLPPPPSPLHTCTHTHTQLKLDSWSKDH